MSEEEARKDANEHYDMSEWLAGEKHANDGIPPKDYNKSYEAGYSFGIWSQERDSGVHG